MLLFFRLICGLLVFIVLLSIILIFSDVKVILNTFEYSTSNPRKKAKYKGRIEIYFLGKVKIFSKKIDSKKAEKLFDNSFIKEKISKINIFDNKKATDQYQLNQKIIKELRKNIKIEKLKFQIQIDTENVLLTSYIVAIISSIIPNLIKDNIRKYNSKNYEWGVYPIYNNKNFIRLNLNSIISIKVVHIINMLKLIGGNKNERASNRRLNVNCYGEY